MNKYERYYTLSWHADRASPYPRCASRDFPAVLACALALTRVEKIGSHNGADNQLRRAAERGSSTRSHLEYIIVEEYHDDAGYVEAGQARVDDKIRIVEQALVRYPVGGVIQTQDNRTSDRGRYRPDQQYRQPYSSIVLVLRVLYRLGHRYVSAIQIRFACIASHPRTADIITSYKTVRAIPFDTLSSQLPIVNPCFARLRASFVARTVYSV